MVPLPGFKPCQGGVRGNGSNGRGGRVAFRVRCFPSSAGVACPFQLVAGQGGICCLGHGCIRTVGNRPWLGFWTLWLGNHGFPAGMAELGHASARSGAVGTPDIGRRNPSRGSLRFGLRSAKGRARLPPPNSLTRHSRGEWKGRSEPLKDIKCPL